MEYYYQCKGNKCINMMRFKEKCTTVRCDKCGYITTEAEPLIEVEEAEDLNAVGLEFGKKIPEKDIINTPSHYTQGGIEPIDYTVSNKLNFCEGNVIKYVTRYKHKNGLEDLKKARFYIDKLIEDYENKRI